MSKADNRTRITPLRLQPRYLEMIQSLGDHYGEKRAAVVRRAIEWLHISVFGDDLKPPKKPGRKREKSPSRP